jgi:hypothetical protein
MTQVSNQDRELHLKEADWVFQEMTDFVKLIQRYRSLYITAIFAALGWLLGQITRSDQTVELTAVMRRTDVAAAVCGLAPLNVLFFSLMMEAAAQVQSLARYRFLLGWRIAGRATWGWEIWKEGEGSIRHWTNPTNIFFGVFGLIGTLLLLSFPIPALLKGDWPLNILYTLSLGFSVTLLFVVVRTGLKFRTRNVVAVPPVDDWWQHMIKEYGERHNVDPDPRQEKLPKGKRPAGNDRE